MGVLKPFLKFSDGCNFLENIISHYRKAGVKDLVIVVNQHLLDDNNYSKISLLKDCHLVLNKYPEYGRSYSMKLGLKKLDDKNPAFIQNIDNPFLKQSTLNILFNGISNADVAIPTFQGRNGHPVLLNKPVINAIIRNINPDINFRELINSFSQIKIEVDDPGILVNINTPEDYSNYFPIKSEHPDS